MSALPGCVGVIVCARCVYGLQNLCHVRAPIAPIGLHAVAIDRCSRTNAICACHMQHRQRTLRVSVPRLCVRVGVETEVCSMSLLCTLHGHEALLLSGHCSTPAPQGWVGARHTRICFRSGRSVRRTKLARCAAKLAAATDTAALH